MQGRPGPVVIALPEDMLLESARRRRAGPRVEAVETWPGLDPDGRAAEAPRGRPSGPIVVLGGSRWSETACAACARFAERFDLPVATSRSAAQMLFPGDHPNYAGEIGIGPNPKLHGPHREAPIS